MLDTGTCRNVRPTRPRAVHRVGCHVGLLLVVLALAPNGCSSPPSSWALDRAEQHLRQNEHASALRYTSRELQLHPDHPGARLIELHGAILQAMTRTAEAEAFLAFSKRHAAGDAAPARSPQPSWRECSDAQEGFELIRSWGPLDRRVGSAPVGTLAASFEVDHEGAIRNIEVLRASDPAAAWLIIESIATSRISQTQLARRRQVAPDSFPLPLCAWWTYAPSDDLGDFRIRGAGRGIPGDFP